MSIKDVIKVYSDLRNHMDDTLALDIKNWLKEWLVANPKVAAIWWNQGTPLYSDGDVCEFNVSEIWVTPPGEDEYDYGETPAYLVDKLREVEDVITDRTIWPVLQSLYGDGVTVMVTQTETKVVTCIY